MAYPEDANPKDANPKDANLKDANPKHKDADPSKITSSAGNRIDVDARRTHEVWIGPHGCIMVIGKRDGEITAV
ncbi:hypothetical protein SAMD00023353_4400090 [Rosellinia necatrix]|uniref:Uncharacterized protein n=1 Tax=Rosellinia necatrix TaxID=77044 RepID=A0A1W2TNG4_ROSNE|nr:hypothetical protein SAMD00023353_4400090 [Rosellinia necatrix]